MTRSKPLLPTVIGISMAVFPGVLASSMLALGYGRLAEDLGVDYQTFQLRNVLFFGIFSASLAYFGAIIGRLGPRRCLLFGQALFVVSTLASWAAQSWTMFLAAQCAQAIADGLVVPCQMSLIRAAVPTERLGWAFGWFHGCLAFAGLVGPAAGSLVAAWFGYRSVFLALTAVALICLAVSARTDTPSPALACSQAPSIASVALLLSMLVGVELCLNCNGWVGHPLVGVFTLAALCLCFLAAEHCARRRGRCGLVPWEALRRPEFGGAVLRIFLVFLVTNGILLHNPTALQKITSLGATSIGMVLTSVALLEVLLMPMLGRFADRQGRSTLVAGLGLATVTTGTLAWIPGSPSPLLWLIVATAGMALGGALFAPTQLRQATLAAAPEERDRFMGFYMFVQFSTGALAGPFMAACLLATPGGSMTARSYVTFVAVCVGLLALGCVTALIARRDPGQDAFLQ